MNNVPDPRNIRKLVDVCDGLAKRGVSEVAIRESYGQSVIAVEWNAMNLRLQNCSACELAKTCANKVSGVGPMNSPIMLVGEAPGAVEELLWVPFVGDSGQILTMALSFLKVDRNRIYITNVVKCRPPGNRTPEQAEIDSCLPVLRKEIMTVSPKVIVTLGNIAMRELRNDRTLGIKRERGTWHDIEINGKNIRVLHTYHPSYVLRSLGDVDKSAIKQEFLADLRLAIGEVRGLEPHYRFV